MARIRTIKPEFWDSPGIETLDPQWRLLYIAMWNWADDTGTGKAEARELMGFAFPRDEEMTVGDFRRGLGEVRRVFGVKFWKSAGRSYYTIPSWEKHQKIDKRSSSKYPSPEGAQTYDPETNALVKSTFGGDSEEPAEDPPSIRRDSGAGTGEQGNRGTVSISSTADASDKTHARASGTDQDDQQFDDWYKNYPKKVGKGQARKAFKAALKKTDLETLHAGLVAYIRSVSGKDRDFIANPATWLNGERWTDEDIASVQRPIRAPEPELPPFIPESQRKYA